MPKKKADFLVPVWGPTQQPIHRWQEWYFKAAGGGSEAKVYVPGNMLPGASHTSNWVHESDLDYIPNDPKILHLKYSHAGGDGNFKVVYLTEAFTGNSYIMDEALFIQTSRSYDVQAGIITNPNRYVFQKRGRSYHIVPVWP